MNQSAIIEELLQRIQDPRRARTMGTFGGFRVFPVAAEAEIQKAEQQLGFPLPRLLRELYLKVGNGGFGPGYGIFGLAGGAPAIDGGGNYYDLVSFYQLHTGGRTHPKLSHDFTRGSLFLETLDQWYDQLVPICDWGCDIYSLIDCSKEDAPVILYIGYGGELSLEANSLEEWFYKWLKGIPTSEWS
ncbi:MAG: SMI1/KNR4 family protein [Chloroflexi bacterium]|jgi:hypothetical protein|nr:SMI1/KNR4 family protein [Chloroflexota bacterium]